MLFTKNFQIVSIAIYKNLKNHWLNNVTNYINIQLLIFEIIRHKLFFRKKYHVYRCGKHFLKTFFGPLSDILILFHLEQSDISLEVPQGPFPQQLLFLLIMSKLMILVVLKCLSQLERNSWHLAWSYQVIKAYLLYQGRSCGTYLGT